MFIILKWIRHCHLCLEGQLKLRLFPLNSLVEKVFSHIVWARYPIHKLLNQKIPWINENWVFASDSKFLISLITWWVNLWYFKVRLINLTECTVRNIGIQLCFAMLYGLENQSLWQRPNFLLPYLLIKLKKNIKITLKLSLTVSFIFWHLF